MTKVLKKIGTHDGTFHCDEVLACFMLKLLPEFSNSEIIRTRNEDILKTCDIVVDVGGVYDPTTHRYDHHQKSFNHTMKTLVPSRPWDVRLSSAGLVYHHFGEKILKSILGTPQDEEIVANMFDYVYENFIIEIDGIDNGVPMFDGEPTYRIHTNLSSRVGYLNPSWNDKEPHDSAKLFHSAMDMVGKEFMDKVQYFINSWWPAKEIVKSSIANRYAIHESGEIVELERFCPWKLHLSKIEEELNIKGTIKFIIFSDNNGWRVQAVPIDSTSFVCRIFLHEKWRGLRDEELSKVSGISDSIFVHQSGFIGGNKTRNGVLQMALKTLASRETL